MSDYEDDIREEVAPPAEEIAEPADQVPGEVRTNPTESRRLLPGWNRPDPLRRPHDPAGSYPRHRPEELLPETAEPLVTHARPSVVFPKAPLAAGPAAPAAASDGPVPEPPEAARFQFVFGAMIAVAVAGLLLLLVAALDTDDTPSGGTTFQIVGPRWSPWAPYQGSIDGPTQIADHVGAQYKLNSGRQLVAITGGPLEIAGLPLTVALRQAPARGGGIQLYEGKGVLYRLCGLGDRCAISSGKASVERHLLLRREALELALYSFRYIKDVSQVVVFLPPRKGEDPSQALFFRPSDVARELSVPLRKTIPSRTPTVTNVRRAPRIALVDQLTVKSLFQFSLTQGNADMRAFLVLDKITS
jgi:hypothetical protein